jgi:hypothetical protein
MRLETLIRFASDRNNRNRNHAEEIHTMRESRTPFTLIFSLLLVATLAASAIAQTTTATIRGKVTDQNGGPVANAEVNAVSTQSGFVHTVTSRSDGSFLLAGLTPGPYNIIVASPGFEPRSDDLTVLVGQTIEGTFRLTPAVVLTEEITVIGNVPVDMQSHEISTNVTQRQIESLPQSDRNFLNFAALSPGVSMSTDPTRKEVRAGAQGASATNVFIDGVSFKNDLIQGGVIGQDSSRGNPFPQSAVQEFRVITQNYSAEYQKASSAIITAVTRSGTNTLRGDLFAYYQDKDLVDDDPFAGPNDPKPAYERLQWGLSGGGPIIRDRMHFFASYESNDQDRQERVTLGSLKNTPFGQQFLDREGVFTQPFREDLFFAKVSFQPSQRHLLDLSGSFRDETDIRSFGGDRSFEAGENVAQKTWSANLRHQLSMDTWLNEASLSYSHLDWHPKPVIDAPSFLYLGIGWFGGRGGEQHVQQGRLSLRDDVTFAGLKAAGTHTLKVGAIVDSLEYSFFKNFLTHPVYLFRSEENFEFPFEAEYAFGDPNLAADNQSYGFYVQDEWEVSAPLLLSLGFRWDHETNMFDPDYVTPAEVRDTLSSRLPAKYFTDGDDRDKPNMLSPRFGFSYDVFQTARTVAFGGWGRYYDRVLFNDILDVRFREAYRPGRFRFSANGLPRDGLATVQWNPRYLTEAGLAEVLATGVTGEREAFLLENDTEVPYADQWNLGVRQSFGAMFGSIAYSNIRSYHGLSWQFAFRNPDGSCCAIPVEWPFGNVLISNDDVQSWYNAVYVTLDRPITADTRWGFNVAYTFSDAERNGDDRGSPSFALAYPTIEEYGQYRPVGAEDHRLVLSGMVEVPWDVLLSTMIQYGSGPYFGLIDASGGFGFPRERYRGGALEGEAYTTIDLRAEKDFRFGGNTRLGIILEAFNVTNDERFSCYQDFLPPEGNPRLGQPGCIVSGTQRRFQVGARFGF